MIALAVVFGGSAILVAHSWLKRQTAESRPSPTLVAEAPRATIVVAASALRYGDEVTSGRLKEIAWPGDALPPGAFGRIEEVTRDGPRLVLSALEANEPVLQGKITGAGQRATLSALIDPDMNAVTIQVDEVVGIAGWVLPGDRVDVFLTQQSRDDGGGAFNDRILQNVRVLAVGQAADQKLDKPTVVRAVTLEVDPLGAQKVALAAKLGSLSLALRKAGETASRSGRRLAASEVGDSRGNGDAVTIQVTRGGQKTVYSVPRTPTDMLPDIPTVTGNTKRGAAPVRNEATAIPAGEAR
jgi:pilus assembly protein CpaB